MRKILPFLMMFCVMGVFANEKVMPRFAIPTARSAGMGGDHVAYTDNVFSLLVNPAAMMRVEQRSFFALSPTLFSPQSTFGLIDPVTDMINGNTSALGDAAEILGKQKGKVPLGFELGTFPLSIAWVADGFGFGLWNRVFVNSNIIGTSVEVNVYGDVILPIGFAFKILDLDAHTVDMGLTLKPFVRVQARERVSILELQGNTDFLDDMSVPVIAGGGFDLGLMYRWNPGWGVLAAGLTFDDITTRGTVVADIMGTDESSYYVPFSMNMGLAYDFQLGNFWKGAPRGLSETAFVFAFDWRDISNAFQQDDYTKRNYLLDLSAGFQVSLFKIINLRLGMNEMLPAVGLGFDLGPIKIDAAYYGRELGLEPGQLSTAAVDVSIAIRPDAKKRDWPWTRSSVVGMLIGQNGKGAAASK